MSKIKVKNIFAAVSNKFILDPLLSILDPKSRRGLSSPVSLREDKPRENIKFWGTGGTVKYLKSKGFGAESVVGGFDFGGRVKSLDREVFVRILADRTNKKHLEALRVELRQLAPFDLIIVDLYPPDPKTFPESMDIGGQALIRAAVKNYKNVAVAFDGGSIGDLVRHLKANQGSTLLEFRKKQAQFALKFIAQRATLEMTYDL